MNPVSWGSSEEGTVLGDMLGFLDSRSCGKLSVMRGLRVSSLGAVLGELPSLSFLDHPSPFVEIPAKRQSWALL